MKKIQVVCPICNKAKFIPVPKEIFSIDEGYLLKYPILKGELCEHEFLCLIDYNFKIRDYETQNIQDYLRKFQESNKTLDFSYF